MSRQQPRPRSALQAPGSTSAQTHAHTNAHARTQTKHTCPPDLASSARVHKDASTHVQLARG
eukprot:14524815-Alexandrium_andersonii.AAC.1